MIDRIKETDSFKIHQERRPAYPPRIPARAPDVRGDSDAEMADAGRTSDSGQARNAGSANGCFPMGRNVARRGSQTNASGSLVATPFL